MIYKASHSTMSQLLLRRDITDAVEPWLVKICPTMDIVAFAAKKDVVEVCRFDGQRVFEHERGDSDDSAVASVAWRPDGVSNTQTFTCCNAHHAIGKLISVVWSDGLMQLVESTQGKVVDSAYSRPKDDGAEPTTLKTTAHGYSTNYIEDTKVSRQQDADIDDLVDDWAASLDLNEDSHGQAPRKSPVKDDVRDLTDYFPRRLALIDVEADLPRLSLLPHTQDIHGVNGSSPDLFSTQEAVDRVFDTDDTSSNTIDVITAAWTDANLTITIPNFLSEPPSPTPFPPNATLTAHTSHATSSGHALITTTPTHQLSLTILYLNPLRECTYYFALITRLTSHLQTVSTYILQTLLASRAAHRTATELPSRFISIIRENLQEDNEHTARRGKPDLDAAFYHTASLGDLHPVLREWLADVLQDRGHKRWEQAVTTGLEEVVRLTNICLLPALDRGSVIASRLRGLSRMDPPLPIWRVNEKELTRVLTDLDILRLVGNHLLRHAATELSGFRVFSTWLSYQIVIASADSPDSQSAIDAAEKASALDHATLLSYITGPLLKSHLNYFLTRTNAEIMNAPRTAAMQWKWGMMSNVLEGHEKRCIQPRPGKEGMPGGRVEVVNVLWQGLMIKHAIEAVTGVPKRGFWEGCNVLGPLDLQRGNLQDARMDPKGEEMELKMLKVRDQEALEVGKVMCPAHDGTKGLQLKPHWIELPVKDGPEVVTATFVTGRTILAMTASDGVLQFAVCTIPQNNESPAWLQLDMDQVRGVKIGEAWDCRLDHEQKGRVNGKGDAMVLVAGMAKDGKSVSVLSVGLRSAWATI